jgi:hypothetical protein
LEISWINGISGCGWRFLKEKVKTFSLNDIFLYEGNHSMYNPENPRRFTKTLAPELVKQIIELAKQGINRNQICKKLNINWIAVEYYLDENHIEYKNTNAPLEMVSETEAKCRVCKEIKNINEFSFKKLKSGARSRHTFCKTCLRKREYNRLNSDVNKYLASRWSYVRGACKEENIIFDISREDFIQQYSTQNGKCFYTDTEFVWSVGNGLDRRKSISVDRIIPELGYVKNNVVFCTYTINTCKNDLSLSEMKLWMPPIYEKIINHDPFRELIAANNITLSADIYNDLNIINIQISA